MWKLIKGWDIKVCKIQVLQFELEVHTMKKCWILYLLAGLKEKGEGFSQRHPSNWVDADEEDDEGEDDEMCVQSTPPYYEEQ